MSRKATTLDVNIETTLRASTLTIDCMQNVGEV